MTQSKKEFSKTDLKSAYFKLVRKGIQIQKMGDIKAYAQNAIKAEQIAQKMQQLARAK